MISRRLCRHYRRVYSTDTATTQIYTLSLHDALPIFSSEMTHYRTIRMNATGKHKPLWGCGPIEQCAGEIRAGIGNAQDRKSTRLNSSHRCISYAVFCLKKKK